MRRVFFPAAVLVLLQLGIGAAMVMSLLAPALRAMHEAVGIAVWLTMFLAAYLARTADIGQRTSDIDERTMATGAITHG